ncbi:equilibrative nucleobase transporter 1 isoform X2 [Ambystoma mexicanum]|uniref:equilibrative nucleobase transporter 1 isoform X2 n=1 Tax=Ambystoma mexicanum TaxID=8296 RepID=UPI0037E8FAD0
MVASRAKRLATFITGLVECMGFAGVVFGWASLVFVLKEDKYYADLCVTPPNSTKSDCSAQDERFSLIFTVASFLNNFMTLPNGFIFDRFGTLVTRLLGIFLYTTATLLIAFSSAVSSWLLFPALSLIAIGGIIFILTNMQVGNLFGKKRSTIITLYNGAFDSSSAVFLLIKVMHEQGISLLTTFLCMAAFSTWHLVRTFFLMPRMHIPYPLPEDYSYGVTCRKPGVYSLNAVSPDGLRRRRAKDANGTENDKPLTDTDTASPNTDTASPNTGRLFPSSWSPLIQSLPSYGAISYVKSPSSEPPVATFRSCVLSCLFAWHLVWMSVMQLRHYLFIGTLNPMLTHLSHGDQNLISSYTNAFAFTQLCAVFCAPWNGLIMDRHKRGKKEDSGTPASNMLDDLRSSILSLAITCVQCVVFSIFAAIPILSVQYATFIFQVVNRSFLFGGNAAFLAMAFPLQHFGKLYGLVMALSAIVSLLQYPCFALMKNVLGGDPFYVNIGMLIFILLAFIHPINVFFECRKREQALPKAPAMLADEGRGQADSNI